MTADFGPYALSGAPALLLKTAQAMPANGLGRKAALALRKLVRLMGYRTIDAEVQGIKMRFYTEDNVSERKFLFMPKFFDAAERALIAREMQPGALFLDIGANAGIYSLWAAKYGARVISVEPNPKVMERFKFNAAINGFETRITPVQMGVSDHEGSFDLYLDPSNLGGSSLNAQAGEKITVPCKTLLGILQAQNISRVDFMKIDIEGAEDRALIPFFRDAPPNIWPRRIIIENSARRWENDPISALEAKGYQRLLVTRMNLVFGL